MQYRHTQVGPLHHVLLLVAAILFFFAGRSGQEPVLAGILAVVASVVLLFAFCFRSLTVADDGNQLAIWFGPIPLFRRSISYSEITSVEPGRSSFIDGWGVHYIPGRGWTYNLWGFGCAVVHLGERIIRIGTDDVENLVEFLKTKMTPVNR